MDADVNKRGMEIDWVDSGKGIEAVVRPWLDAEKVVKPLLETEGAWFNAYQNTGLNQLKNLLSTQNSATEALEKLKSAASVLALQDSIVDLLEKPKLPIPSIPPLDVSTIPIPTLSDMNDREDEIISKKEELTDYGIINTSRQRGLSDAALFVYEIITSPPTEASNSCQINSSQYMNRFHYNAFKYGLRELQLMGYIYYFVEGVNHYVLYFSPLGINAFSDSSLLCTTSTAVLTAAADNLPRKETGYDRELLDTAVLYLMRECGAFETHLPFLVEYGYVDVRNRFLYWLKSKQSLAQYFGDVLGYKKWSDIEKAFTTSKLNGAYHHASADSLDYVELKDMLKSLHRV